MLAALACGGWEGVAWCRGVGAVGGFTAAAVTDAEEDALEDILRVETERIGQFAYRATCRGIDGYFDGFHHAREKRLYSIIQHVCYIMLQTIQGVKGIMVLLDAKGTFWCISCLPIGMRMLRISACATVRSFRSGCSSMVSARPCSRSVCNAPGALSTAF